MHDKAVLHRIALSRYSNGVVRKVLAHLNRLDASIVARLAQQGPDSSSGHRLEQLLAGIRDMQAAGWTVLKSEFVSDLHALAESEVQFGSKLVQLGAAAARIDVFSPVPTPGQVISAVQARPFQGKLLREWLDGAEAGQAARVREAIRQGFTEGRTTAEIVQLIRGTKAAQYRDGIMEIGRRGAEAMVHTAISHTANVAHEAAYEANADVVKGVEWVSTLDNRTTPICISRDGNIYPIGKGPRPPAHIRCRSTTAPVLDEIDGVTPFKRQTYAEWLKKQTPETQDEILGRARGALFRSGGVTVDKFVDKGGKTLTLEQLKEKDAKAFEAAGLNHPMKPPPGVPKDEIARFLADEPAQRRLIEDLYGNSAESAYRRVRRVAEEQGWQAQEQDLVAIRYYTGSGYEAINRRMREGGGALEDRQFTALASRGLGDLPDETSPVWRAPARRSDVAERMWQGARVGEDLDLGNQLQSFSRSKGIAQAWSGNSRLLLEIRNPRQGSYIDPVSENPGEHEVLFPLGVRYRVAAKREETADGQVLRVLVLEVVE
jgi:SPP1 gp7 family putative phage head morphogenesis protein